MSAGNAYLRNPLVLLIVAMHLAAWMAALFLRRAWPLALPYLVFAANEVAYRILNVDMWRSSWRTRAFYDVGDLVSTFGSVGTNFTEGYYPRRRCAPHDVAEKAKFARFAELVRFRPGDRVLDLGCGMGGLYDYFTARGGRVVGVTISEAQARMHAARGRKVVLGDFTTFIPALEGRFDIVFSIGALEHVGGGNPAARGTYERKADLGAHAFALWARYFASDTKGRLLVSTLHINPEASGGWQAYAMERTYGGSYFLDRPGFRQADCLTAAGFRVEANLDTTLHYYMASYCDKAHFGNPVEGAEKLLWFAPLYPLVICAYIYSRLGLWMWQFDGKLHSPRDTECGGTVEHPTGCDLTFNADGAARPVTLYWTLATYGMRRRESPRQFSS